MRDREPTGSKAPTAAPDPARDACAQLEARLGLGLRDPELALAALTHKSFVNEHRGEGLTDNERLEFLGDAVIDLAVSHRLMERFPGAREGDLSKIRASLVDESGLAGIARQLDLGPLLRLGRGEEITGGRQKASLLADAFEAVIAALYLGGGLQPVLSLIDRLLGDAFARAAAGTLDRDYKTQLQELSQSRLRATPRYRVVAEIGPDHSKTFEVELEVRGEPLGRGRGRSKKDAEQAAAKLGLEALGMRYAAEAAAREAGSEAAAAAVEQALVEQALAEQAAADAVEAPVVVATAASVVLAERAPMDGAEVAPLDEDSGGAAALAAAEPAGVVVPGEGGGAPDITGGESIAAPAGGEQEPQAGRAPERAEAAVPEDGAPSTTPARPRAKRRPAAPRPKPKRAAAAGARGGVAKKKAKPAAKKVPPVKRTPRRAAKRAR